MEDVKYGKTIQAKNKNLQNTFDTRMKDKSRSK